MQTECCDGVSGWALSLGCLGRLTPGSAVAAVAMSLIGFIGIHSVGNPVFNVVNIETATPEDIQAATIALGLDQPIWQPHTGCSSKMCVSGQLRHFLHPTISPAFDSG